jgi:soluble lytic murein transglycosylase-like protein
MAFCLRQSLLGLLLVTFAAHLNAANLVKQTVVAPRASSVVRADARGRLVRTVVVSSRAIQPRVVNSEPVPGSATAKAGDLTGVPDLVQAAARKYDLDPLLVHSLIQVESAYNPHAVSSKGAQGLMQLMPGTARRFGVSNSFDPEENIEGGVRYLKYLTTLFPTDMRLALAAYNAGEGAVWKYNSQIPPYRETEDYIYKVARRYGEARREAQRSAAVQTAKAAEQAPAGPVYLPIQYYVDAEGRLHMQTVAATDTTDVRTP